MSTESHSIKLSVEGKARLKQMERSVSGSLQRMDRAVAKFAGGLALLGGAGGIGLLISRQVEAAKQADAWSKAIGVNVEALTAWQFAGEAVGLSQEKIADIMKDAAEKIGDAYRNNAGEAKEALQSLNLSVAEMARLSPEKQLLAIAQQLGNVATQGERVQIMEALASDASLLLPLLEDNAAELQRLTDLADRTGAVLTQEEVDKLQQAGENIREMNAAFEGLSQTLALEMVPALNKIIDKVSNGIVGAFNLAREAADRFVEWQSGPGIIGGRLQEEEEKLQRLRVAHRMARGAAKAAALERVREQEAVVEAARKADEKLRARADQWREQSGYGQQDDDKKPGGGIRITVTDGAGFSDEQQKQLERLRDSLRSQEQVLADALFQRQEIITEAADAGVIAEQERLDLLFAINNEYEDKLTALMQRGLSEREKFQQLSAKAQTKTVIGELVNMTAGVAQHNRKLFELNKAAGIANAVVNTYEGVTKTLAKYPWPLSGVMAAAHLAAGLAQVDAIQSASFGGSGGAAPSLAGSTAAPPVTPVEPLQQPTSEADTGREITIRIVGDGKFKDLVIESIEEAEANDEIRILSD